MTKARDLADYIATGVSGTELDILDGLTTTTAELNILDGVTATTAELNYTDGVTSAIQTQLNTKGVTAGSSSIVTTGALNSGSITSGFGNIDSGASTITTTGLISGGSLDIDNVLINGTTIGHTDDTDLITLANGLVTVAGEVSMTTLDIGGTNVTSTAAELNILDGVTSTAAELNYNDITTLGTVQASKVVTADANGDVTFPDNDKAIFGAGSDLQIYHDGSDSIISDQGTGDLQLRVNNLRVLNDSGDENLIHADRNSAVRLYFDNALKVETTSYGTLFTGNSKWVDNGKATFGTGDDLQIYHDGSHSYIDDAATGNLRLRGDGLVQILSYSDNETMAYFQKNGAVGLYHDNAEKITTTATGINVTGNVNASGGNLYVGADDSVAGNLILYGAGAGTAEGAEIRLHTSADHDGVIDLWTIDINGDDLRMFTSAGDVAFLAEPDGGVTLKYNNATKFATTATGATITGAVKPTTYQETYIAKSAASTVTCDLATGTHFSVTVSANTTFAFTNPPSSGTSYSFTLIITQHSTAVTLTWPSTVDWAGGAAPDPAGNNEVQAYGFITRDGGTTYYGFLGGTAIA